MTVGVAQGKLAKLEKAQHDDRNMALQQLARVHGIGPKFAATLYDTHHIKSIAELLQHSDMYGCLRIRVIG